MLTGAGKDLEKLSSLLICIGNVEVWQIPVKGYYSFKM